MKQVRVAATVAALLMGTGAAAQDAVYWSAPAPAGAARATSYFPMGTPITLTTRTQVSTKDNKPGDRIFLDVAESLTYRDQVVIPAGAVAVAEVARADRNGHFGKKGKLDIHLLYVETPYGRVRLSGQANDEGTSGTIVSVATIAFVSPLGFLVHGTSAHIPFGTPVQAYLADPLRFTPQPGGQAVAATPEPAPRALPAAFVPAPRTASR